MEEYNTYMAKLTLSVDEAVVAVAKRYAARRGTSVSRLVERYLELLARPTVEPGAGLPPITRGLRGILRGAASGRDEYRRHLARKYR
jgi:hypothetical protein